jgi:hypothetical protein
LLLVHAQGIGGDAKRVFAHCAKTEAPQSPVLALFLPEAKKARGCAQIPKIGKRNFFSENWHRLKNIGIFIIGLWNGQGELKNEDRKWLWQNTRNHKLK